MERLNTAFTDTSVSNRAEIKEVIASNGSTIYGYALNTRGSLTSDYTHHTTVDGDTKYGKAVNCFPRRCLVATSFNDNVPEPFGGSRSIACQFSFQYTNGSISKSINLSIRYIL